MRGADWATDKRIAHWRSEVWGHAVEMVDAMASERTVLRTNIMTAAERRGWVILEEAARREQLIRLPEDALTRIFHELRTKVT